MVLIQIVTGLPPLIDGIGDYALQLARQLRIRHNVDTHFIVGDPAWSGGHVEGFPASRIVTRSEESLIRCLEQVCRPSAGEKTRILLHASPYGYAKRGCPIWLADAVEEWNRRQPFTVNVAFHELAVTSALPWSSAFWLAPLQRKLSTRIAKAANFRYSNTEDHRSRLERWGAGRTSLIMNCASTIEPRFNPPFVERSNDIVIFGRPDHRRLTYTYGKKSLRLLCARLGTERIVDIGMPIPEMNNVKEICGVPIHQYGRLTAEQVSLRMARAVASFTYYPVTALGKSSIYQVSCSHGTVPFIFDEQVNPRSCPGLTVGKDFIPLPESPSDPQWLPLETLSQLIFDRYQVRASWALADNLAEALNL